MKGATVGGRFRLEERLGEGGMGIVWEATNLRTQRIVALKILKAETPQQRRRLFREGKIAGQLRHPHIVDVHDVVELDDGTPAIVMERLRGESLRALLVRETKLSPARVAELFTPIARALECAHAQGVVHRDLKPDNVFLAHDAVKVLDFGIARLTTAEDAASATAPLTDTGDVIGTPAYMAPEQVFGEKNVDTRVDVWSFGVMLFECLSGRKPFVGDNFGQIWKAVAMGTITPLADLEPELPNELTALVMSMLSRERSERPTDWSSIIAVLEHRGRVTSRRSHRWVPVFALASALAVGSIVALRWSPRPAATVARVVADDASAAVVKEEAPTVLAATAAPSSAASSTAPPPRSAPRPVVTVGDTVLPGGVHGKSPY